MVSLLVCLYCWSQMWASKNDSLIQVPFRVWIPQKNGNWGEEGASHCKVYGRWSVSTAKMADLLGMSTASWKCLHVLFIPDHNIKIMYWTGNQTDEPGGSKKLYTFKKNDDNPWTGTRAATHWATRTTNFLPCHLSTWQAPEEANVNILLTKVSDKHQNVKVKMLVDDEVVCY